MRAYFFTNMYLSSIQQGIQPLHVVADMFVKYSDRESNKSILLYDWAENHKTVICLNGGYSSNIRAFKQELFESADNKYPWAEFHEGDDALDGALTSIGIILPEHVYSAMAYVRDGGSLRYWARLHTLSDWENAFIGEASQYKMAS